MKKIRTIILILIFILSFCVSLENVRVKAASSSTFSVIGNSPEEYDIYYYNGNYGLREIDFSFNITITNNDGETIDCDVHYNLYIDSVDEDGTHMVSGGVLSNILDGETASVIVNWTHTDIYAGGFNTHGEYEYYFAVYVLVYGSWAGWYTLSTQNTDTINYYIHHEEGSTLLTTVNNPSTNEIFAYTTTDESFEVDLEYKVDRIDEITTYQSSYNNFFTATFYIDDIQISTWDLDDSDSTETTTTNYFIWDWTINTNVDISTLDVGVHTFKSVISNFYCTETFYLTHCNYTTITDTVSFYRDNPPPNNPPSIVWANPAANWDDYNRTADGDSYTIQFTPTDVDNDISTIHLWTNDVLNQTWVNPTTDVALSQVVITAIDGLYNFTLKATDDQSNTYTTTRLMYVVSLGGNINTTIYARDDTYLMEAPYLKIGTLDEEGLDNCTITIDITDVNITYMDNSVIAVKCNLSTDILISILDFYRAIDFTITYDKVEAWNETFIIVDSGDEYALGYDEYDILESGATGHEWFAYIDENGYLRPFLNDNGNRVSGYETNVVTDDNGNKYTSVDDYYVDDNGNRYTLENDMLVDDNGNRFYVFMDENIVDSGEVNSYTEYNEDTMANQAATDWTKYKYITLTNPTSTTFTNFVAYVKVAYESAIEPDWVDLRFYDSTGTTLLDYDVGEYTDTGGAGGGFAHCWVEIPTFTASSTYTIKMLYGNGAAGVTSAEDEQGTWDDNNVELAMHLDTNDDSSGNSYDFTDTGDGVSYSASQIGDGVELQGTNDYLYRASGSSEIHNLGTDFTILSWIWCEDDLYNAQYSMTADGLSLIFVPEITTGDIFRIEGDGNYVSESTTTSFTEDTYAHLTTKVTGGNAVYWFVAGQQVDSDVLVSFNLNEADNGVYLGIEQALNNDLNGFLDELFVISEAWSDDEIEAFYEFQGNQATYVSFGSEQINYDDWNVGSEFTWSVSADASGERTTGIGYFDIYDDGGGSSWIRIPDSILSADDETDAWVKWRFMLPDEITDYVDISFNIMVAWDDYQKVKFDWDRATETATFGTSTSSVAGVGTWLDSATWSQSFSRNTWYEIEIRVDFANDNGYCYVDNVLKDSTSFTGYDDFTLLRHTEISIYQDGNGKTPNLRIDEVSSKADGGTYVIDETGYYTDSDWFTSSEGWDYSVWNSDGSRDGSTCMTMSADNTGDYVYAVVSDENMLLTEPREDYVVSYEVRVATTTLSKIDTIAFALYGSYDGSTYHYYPKIALDDNGGLFTGISSSRYSSFSYVTGFYDFNAGFGWNSDWITLNITILDGFKIMYFVDDILIRDSVIDKNYWDVSHSDCGTPYLTVDTEAGYTDGNIVVDYFNTIDYDKGTTRSAGDYNYAEYSNPMSARYNGSMYLFSPDDTTCGFQTGTGWATYDGDESISYKTRTRLLNVTSTNLAAWSVKANLNGTDDYYYKFLFQQSGSDRLYTVLSEHGHVNYGSISGTSEYITGVDWTIWHTFEIRVVKDSWIGFLFDDVLIRNETSSTWLDCWNYTSDNTINFSIDNPAGYDERAVMEIDYLTEFNYTYAVLTSSNGWDWSGWSDGVREDGILKLVSRTGNNYHGIYEYGDLYPDIMNGGNAAEYYVVQARVQMPDTPTDYTFVSLGARLSSGYEVAYIIFYQNGTVAFAIVDSYLPQSNTIFYTQTISYTWTQSQWYLLTVVVDHTNKWCAGLIDGQLIYNYTTIYSENPSYFDYSDWSNALLITHGGSTSTDQTCWIDYFQTGWRKDWWYVSSEGWEWSTQTYSVYGDRQDGNIVVWDNAAGSYCYFTDWSEEEHYVGNSNDLIYYSITVKANDSDSNYDHARFYSIKLGAGYYACFQSFTNGTTTIGVTNGMSWGTIYWYQHNAMDFFDVNYHTFEIAISLQGEWVAWVMDNQLLYNYTSCPYTTSSTNDAGIGVRVDSASGQIGHLWIDSVSSGWKKSWSWVSSEGWEYLSAVNPPMFIERDDGYMKMTPFGGTGDKGMILTDVNNLPPIFSYENSSMPYINEWKFLLNDTISDYDHVVFNVRIGAYECNAIWWSNGTMHLIIANGLVQDWWSIQIQENILSQVPIQDQLYTLSFIVSQNNFVAVVFDGHLLINSTAAGAYATFATQNRIGCSFEESVGNNAHLWIDSFSTGYKDYWWWTSSEGWDWTISSDDSEYTLGERDGSGTFSFWSEETAGDTWITTTSTKLGTIADGYLLETRIEAINSTADYDRVIFSARLSNSASAYAFIGGYGNGSTWVGVCTWQSANPVLETTQISGVNILDGNQHILRINRDSAASQRIAFDIDGAEVHDAVYSTYTFAGEFINANIFIDNAAATTNAMISVDWFGTRALDDDLDYISDGLNPNTWYEYYFLSDPLTTKNWDDGYWTMYSNTPSDAFGVYLYGDTTSFVESWTDWRYIVNASNEDVSDYDYMTISIQANATHYYKLYFNASGSVHMALSTSYIGSVGNIEYYNHPTATVTDGTWYSPEIRVNETDGRISFYRDGNHLYNSTDWYSAWDDTVEHNIYFYGEYDTGKQDAEIRVSSISFDRWNITTNQWVSSSDNLWTTCPETPYAIMTRDEDSVLVVANTTGVTAHIIIDSFDGMDYADDTRYTVWGKIMMNETYTNYNQIASSVKIADGYWVSLTLYQNGTIFAFILNQSCPTNAIIYESLSFSGVWIEDYWYDTYITVDSANGWIAAGGSRSELFNSTTFGSYIVYSTINKISVGSQSTAGNYAPVVIDWLKIGYSYSSQWWYSSEGWHWSFAEGSELETSGDRSDDGTFAFANTVTGEHTALSVYYNQISLSGSFFIETRFKMPNTTALYSNVGSFISFNTTDFGWLVGIMFMPNGTTFYGVNHHTHPTNDWLNITTINSYNVYDNDWHILRLYYYPTIEGMAYELDGVLIANETYTAFDFLEFKAYDLGVGNAAGEDSAYLQIDYLKTSMDFGWVDSSIRDVGLSYLSTPASFASMTWGQDFYVNWTSTSACRITASLTISATMSYWTDYLYDDVADISRFDYWQMNDTYWDLILENDQFWINITLGDDLGYETTYNRWYIKDTIAPTVILFSPENRTLADPYSNLQIIPLSYYIEDLNTEYFTNDDKFLIIDGEVFTGEAWWQYPKHRPLIFYEGWHTLRIQAYDAAGNLGSAYAYFYYEQRVWREVDFSFTSAYDDVSIDAQTYLRLSINGIYVELDDTIQTNFNTFNISIYDNFGNEIYTYLNMDYSRTLSIQLPLRAVNFTNLNAVSCRYEVWSGIYSKDLVIGSISSSIYYLYDDVYTLVASALDPHYTDNIQYITTSASFRVILGMDYVSITLNTYEETEFLMTFTFTSQFDGLVIDSDIYLDCYINGSYILNMYAVNVWSKDNFVLTIYDKFENELYNGTIEYGAAKSITLPMRIFVFTNAENTATTITILQDDSIKYLYFPMGAGGSKSVYLSDGEYQVVHSPINPDKEDGVLWVAKTYVFTSGISSQALYMNLDKFQPLEVMLNLGSFEDIIFMLRNIMYINLGATSGIALIGFSRWIIPKLFITTQKEDDKNGK